MKMHKTFLLVLLLLAGGRFAGAQPKPALVPDTDRPVSTSRGAGASSFQITSAILKQARRIYVVLPKSYSQSTAERRYPVTIVLDGEANVPPVAAVSDELASYGQIPESIIVAIPNIAGANFEESARNRVHDLTPPGLSVSGSSLHEGGDLFLDFIEQELLPAVDRQFRGGGPRTFIGHSNGGILATYVAATRPAFRAVLAIDTPTTFGDSWLTKKLMARASASSTPLRYVTYEVRYGWRDDAWQALVAAAPKSWKLHREHLGGESHESTAMLAMYLGLRELYSDYSTLAAPTASTTSILPYYARVGESLGGPVAPPRKLLRSVIEDLLAEGRGAAARDAYNLLVSAYGAPSDGPSLLAQITEVARLPPPTETVEELLATPFPNAEAARPFIGEWVGDVWMGDDEPRTGKQRLRIQIVNGQVTGETVNRDAPGGPFVQHWQYMKVTPAGLTFGFMNGMRPRGVVLFEGKLSGDTLSGTNRFGGVNFRGSDGSSPPPLHFSFKRVGK